MNGRSIQVNEADTDWLVYHQIPEGSPVTTESLAVKCGLAISEVDASVLRLERACLVGRSGSSVRVLSIGEALIQNQVTYDNDLPFTIENGVIREKRTACQKKT